MTDVDEEDKEADKDDNFLAFLLRLEPTTTPTATKIDEDDRRQHKMTFLDDEEDAEED